jgi:hypothetical protein
MVAISSSKEGLGDTSSSLDTIKDSLRQGQQLLIQVSNSFHILQSLKKIDLSVFHSISDTDHSVFCSISDLHSLGVDLYRYLVFR